MFKAKLSFFVFFAFFHAVHSLQAITNENKRIILYFDINQTIIAGGIAEQRNFEEALGGIFAKDIVARWDDGKERSYWEYLQDKIAHDMPHLSRAGDAFKKERKRRLLKFPHYLAEHYPTLYEKYKDERARLLEILAQSKGPSLEGAVFPSFFNLITWLNQSGYPYAINLRSFGSDATLIVPVIEENSTLKFKAHGAFKGHVLNIFNNDSKRIAATYSTPQEIYNFFTNPPLYSYVIQDSVEYWKAHGYQASGGKLFPIDLQDTEVVTLFFDDIVGEFDRGIVYPVKPNGEPEDLQKLVHLGYIVTANTKQAILNPNYYIDKVKAKLSTSMKLSFQKKPQWEKESTPNRIFAHRAPLPTKH